LCVRQEAQLSQRGRDVHVVGNIAESLKVTPDYSKFYRRVKRV